ncbi:orotidine-5'-phosphate decarboxylase [Weissella halotolerans]|uniref:Orotidine 5'-phosphate decarboxylase n=1 Tax=Weissella halotolerans DSM 20190 TaxID=1123500 RepID=A0A0R2FR55_9LACO|nr:orotidine-5'-phosphate decarboxylase [Weissella halotolerans]KRN30872.1 orotidine 5-phosphate decarboxylase [Weissella halotolerans DSM 20190]
MQEPVFIALDFKDAQAAWQFLKLFPTDVRPAVKVGMELFYQAGPSLISDLKDAGFDVFLDLKLYDIPHTVEAAVRNLAQLQVDYLTVHAAGGRDMMMAAMAGAQAGAEKVKTSAPKVLAITQLTSFSETTMQATQLVRASMTESVVHLAHLAADSGLAGTISSAYESKVIHEAVGNRFLSITPGIRLAGDDQGDQARVVTPREAAVKGANGIVVGRSITQAKEPLLAYQQVVTEFKEGLTK